MQDSLYNCLSSFHRSSAQTYHFAVLLTVEVCLPFCLFLGLDLDAWLRVFADNRWGFYFCSCLNCIVYPNLNHFKSFQIEVHSEEWAIL